MSTDSTDPGGGQPDRPDLVHLPTIADAIIRGITAAMDDADMPWDVADFYDACLYIDGDKYFAEHNVPEDQHPAVTAAINERMPIAPPALPAERVEVRIDVTNRNVPGDPEPDFAHLLACPVVAEISSVTGDHYTVGSLEELVRHHIARRYDDPPENIEDWEVYLREGIATHRCMGALPLNANSGPRDAVPGGSAEG